MKSLLCLMFLAAAVAAEEPAPPKPQSLAAVKATIQMPPGWFFKEQSEDGVTVYQLSREKAAGSGEVFEAGLILNVTTKVPDRASMKPSDYAAELLASPQEDGSGKLERSEEGPLKVLRIEYAIESDQGAIKIINVAKANDATGTLYFVTWQSPEAEEAKLKPVREALLSSLKVDPSY